MPWFQFLLFFSITSRTFCLATLAKLNEPSPTSQTPRFWLKKQFSLQGLSDSLFESSRWRGSTIPLVLTSPARPIPEWTTESFDNLSVARAHRQDAVARLPGKHSQHNLLAGMVFRVIVRAVHHSLQDFKFAKARDWLQSRNGWSTLSVEWIIYPEVEESWR